MRHLRDALTVCVLSVFSTHIFAVDSDDAKNLCQKGINSVASVGMQLSANPNSKISELNKLIDNWYTNEALRFFLKNRIVPLVYEKNYAVLNQYIESGSALQRCTYEVTKLY
jgi:hypothetical protein